MPDFTHLHVHTQYSILDGAAKISDLIAKVKEQGMDALAITDHGNMFGVLKFFNEAKKHGIKPIIGCEVYVAAKSRFDKQGKEFRSGYHLILLAKNKIGYKNLSRLVSLGYKEGFYYTPRVDKEILQKYSEGLIASSACLGGELPKAIIHKDEKEVDRVLNEFVDIFGEDFYLELQDHGLPEQKTVNEKMLKLSQKHNMKVIATNDVHFVNKEDYDAHKILICLNTGKDLDDVSGMHYTGSEYLKSPREMAELFKDVPEVLVNIREIVDKIEDYEITTKEIILPRFPLPEGIETEDDYLKQLTYRGAERLYPDLTDNVKERLEFELKVIKEMGFPGYFLIVQDFIAKARELGVYVGPGRGSAAGSAVAYCTGITNIDPIKYNLLFERFLNPERISMPDIDIDFDDEGREKVLDYVVAKYGEDHVAQIITFGTMAAKLAIRDVARVLKLPLHEADKLAKLVPEKPGITLAKAFKEVKELSDIKTKGDELSKKTLSFAQILEGSARHTGTHACGVIIGPDDLIDHIPLSTAKDSELMVTQYDGKLVESVGLLKMDFLGLKTLSIIKDAIANIKLRHGIEINIDEIPLEDEKTYKLYQKGDTIGTFQFESDGMRTYLKDLKPSNIEDLIAMNALYRPGPMSFIPVYINRKHGKEKVEYPHPWLEEILKPTHGIMVYQEQIMQTAQIMGGYTLGGADLLRRAMGKKQRDVMEKQKVVFVDGAVEKGVEKETAAEVFQIMERFAEYGFNRSHSAAYSVIAYQTAYLKAHYPAEYMAAVLTHNLSDIKKIKFFIDECKRQNISVLGPDVNESQLNFTVNKNGEIRFGMAAIKGVGEAAVHALLEERTKNGLFKDIVDMVTRVNLRSVNKRCFEALAMSGGFDSFLNTHRAQYFFRENIDDSIFLEKIIKHGNNHQERQNASQVSLFGEMDEIEMPSIKLPECDRWTKLEQLKHEKNVTGFYMSGHPLDDYRIEIDNFCDTTIGSLSTNLKSFKNKNISFAGMVISVAHRMTKNNKPFGSFVLEDFQDTMQFVIFSEDYLKMRHFLEEGHYVLIKARVQNRFKMDENLEIKINQISLLAEAVEKNTREVTIIVNSLELDEQKTQDIEDLVLKHVGQIPFKVRLCDGEEGYSIELKSRKSRIEPLALIKDLQHMDGVKYKLN
jgi:DNA polymerase-3 subunit alpha